MRSSAVRAAPSGPGADTVTARSLDASLVAKRTAGSRRESAIWSRVAPLTWISPVWTLNPSPSSIAW